MIQRAFDVWVDPGMRDALRQRTRPEFDLSVQLYVVNRKQLIRYSKHIARRVAHDDEVRSAPAAGPAAFIIISRQPDPE